MSERIFTYLTVFCMCISAVVACSDSSPTSSRITPATGYLEVMSEPEGATIGIDGEGGLYSTPHIFEGLSVGEHIVTLNKYGWRAWVDTVEIRPNDTTRVNAVLSSEAGSITVTSNPDSAHIWINGEKTQALTPHTFLRMPLDQYDVRVERPGFRPDSGTVYLFRDRERENIDFDLRLICPGENIVGDLGLAPEIHMNPLEINSSPISGVVRNVDLEKTRVVLWAKTDIWYVQPYIGRPYTRPCGDGTWRSGTHPWNRMVAVLVDPSVYEPGAIRVHHPSLDEGVLAWDEIPEGGLRTVDFFGYTWAVKSAERYRAGPGPNYFSDDERDIWVDDEGLHLTTVQRDGKWYSTEVVMDHETGYGEYTFTVGSRLDSLDYRGVFAGFVYESQRQEIDVEFSQRLAQPHNGQYVVQPYTHYGNIERYDVPSASVSTHRFVWSEDRIIFTSWTGDDSEPSENTLIHEWEYTGPDIPTPDKERMRFNLWLFGGNPPLSGDPDEVVIRSFQYKP